MKKVVFLTLLLAFTITANCQQRLSYAYDAAGNRICRTIVLSAHRSTEDAPSTYLDYIGGRQLAINAYRGESRISIAVEEYDTSLSGGYSIIDKDAKLLAEGKLSGENTLVEMKDLPSGSYVLDILIDNQHSKWELIRLESSTQIEMYKLR